MSTLFVVTADSHTNSVVGLCPPGPIELTEGYYTPTEAQEWLWECWTDLWKRIRRIKRKLKCKVYHTHCGDGLDDNSHSQYGLITLNKSLIVTLSAAVMEPASKVADRSFWCAGTPAHVGQDAELEELAAQRAGFEEKNGQCARWRWTIEADGVLCHFAHRPISRSTREHTRGGGAMRTANEIAASLIRLNHHVPDFAFFGHTHTIEDSGENRKPRVIFVPPWKLHGSFEAARGFSAQPIGAVVLLCDEGRGTLYPLDEFLYVPKEDKPWKEK